MKLDKSILDATLTQIADIDKKMTASAGNVTQRKAEARLAIASDETSAAVISAEVEAAAALEAAKSAHDEARQAVEDAIVAYLKASKADVGAELASLRTEREELVNTAKAMGTLLKVSVDVPKAPKGSGSGSSSPRVAKSASGSHYVKAEDGSTSSYANDTFSGLAFYAFKRAGVNDLKSALSANGVTELTKPWETTVTVNGITRTIGHRVDETPATEG
jgi:hypothetical protein